MTEEEKVSGADLDKIRFVSLVSTFASSAYQAMGKIANPLTGKAERNLEAAQGFIDILIMLRNKTSGNLKREEEVFLNSTISDLQLNFVKEKEKPEPAKTEGKEPAPAEPEAGKGKEEKKEEEKEKAEAARGEEAKAKEKKKADPDTPKERSSGKAEGTKNSGKQ